MLYQALRWVSLIEGLLLIGWALAVIQEAKKFRPPNVYVRLITASYVLLVITATIHAAFPGKHETEAHLFVWFRIVALSYGLVALGFMRHYYRYDRRVRRHEQRTDAAGERLRRDADV